MILPLLPYPTIQATLHLIEVTPGTPNEVKVVVLCHTRELAFQIQKEYERFSKYLPDIKSRVFYGGSCTKILNDNDLYLLCFGCL